MGSFTKSTLSPVAALLVLVYPCGSVYPQSRDPDAVPLPRAFVGAGLAPATSDAGARMRLFSEGSSLVWLIEGGVALSSRVGVGAELAQPTAVSATTSGRSFRASGRQEERVVIGLLRARALAFNRLALDFIGGVGLLFQHHERRFSPCFSGCGDTVRETLDRQAPTFAFGAEVPLRVGRHVWISGLARFYALRRGEHTTQVPVLIPWQYEWKSSTRFAIGISGRAGW